MAFDRTYFSSVNNQQCAGERIQTWQYESVDPLSDLTGGGYFDPVRQSVKVNDSIWVVSMDPTRTVAQSRSNLTVRVNGEVNGTSQSALVALPELADTTMTVLEFTSLSATDTQSLPTFPAAVKVVGAYAVLLGTLSGSSSIAVDIKSSDPMTVYSGTLTEPVSYGTSLALTAGTADTDTAFTVTITPTSVPAGSGTLRVFIQTKLA
jgi:hypothetical protein